MMMIFKEWDGVLVKVVLVEVYECEYDVGGWVGLCEIGIMMLQVFGFFGDDDDEGGFWKCVGWKFYEIIWMEIVFYGWKDRVGQYCFGWM